MNAHSSTLYFSICPKTNSIQHGYIRISREKLKRIASRQANNTKIKQKHYSIWAFTSNPVRNVTGINTPWTGRNKKFILKLHMTLNINFTSSLLFSTFPPFTLLFSFKQKSWDVVLENNFNFYSEWLDEVRVQYFNITAQSIWKTFTKDRCIFENWCKRNFYFFRTQEGKEIICFPWKVSSN